MQHFGLHPAAPMVAGVIALELLASAAVLTGKGRWAGAAALARLQSRYRLRSTAFNKDLASLWFAIF